MYIPFFFVVWCMYVLCATARKGVRPPPQHSTQSFYITPYVIIISMFNLCIQVLTTRGNYLSYIVLHTCVYITYSTVGLLHTVLYDYTCALYSIVLLILYYVYSSCVVCCRTPIVLLCKERLLTT